MKYLIVLVAAAVLYGCSPVGKEKRINILFEKANKKLDQQAYNDAIAIYDQILQMDADIPQVYHNRGVAYFETGHLVLALADYNHILEENPDQHDIYFNRARTYLELGRYESCQLDVDYLKKQFPDSALVYFIEGLLLHHTDENKDALEAFDKSLELDGNNAETFANRGMVRFALEDYALAEMDLIASLKIDPGNAYPINALALVKVEQKELAIADSLINKALRTLPDHPAFLNNRGYIYVLQGNLEQAETDIQTSLKLDPENAWGHQNLGLLYLERKEPLKAQESLKDALDLNPNLKKAPAYLVRAHLATGSTTEACQTLANYPALKQAFPKEVAECEEKGD